MNGTDRKRLLVIGASGLLGSKIMAHTDKFAGDHLESEVTISSAVAAEAMTSGMYDGIVAIAPFACLIGRLIKSFLNPWMREQNYPFIVIENDGLAYPLNVINQLEMFMLNVQRYGEAVPNHAQAIREEAASATADSAAGIADQQKTAQT